MPARPRWPLLRQIRDPHDHLGLGVTAASQRSVALTPRTARADRVVRSICPFCAVGCGQLVHVKDDQVIQIEGDPDSPISRGRLCPKGSASRSLVTSPARLERCRYRAPFATEWQEVSLERAMAMIADRVLRTRVETWQERDADGQRVNRTTGIANLGGATLDNEENYLIKKLCMGLGVTQVENQARI